MKRIIETRENGTKRIKHLTEGPSLTKSSLKDLTDINQIVKKYARTGQWSHVSNKMPWYGDVSGISDFKSAQDKVLQAQEEFLKLPAALREEFANDPGNLIEFLRDPKNKDRAIELGLVEAPKIPVPVDSGKKDSSSSSNPPAAT